MGIKPFVVMFFGFLICNIVYGTNLVADDEGTKIGCFTRDITCGRDHEYNIKESPRGMFNKNITGGKCMNGDADCNDVSSRKSTKTIINNNNRDNGSKNFVGNNSGSKNGRISGGIQQNGNGTVNGHGSVNAISVAIGNNTGNGDNPVNNIIKGTLTPPSGN